MDTAMRAQLLKDLQSRRDSIVERWYQAIEHTCYVSLSAQEVRQHLAELIEQAITLLLVERFDPAQAQEIGAALAGLHYTQPEALGGTLGVLASEFYPALPADQAETLGPRVAMLVEGIAVGFSRRASEIILSEQEQIRAALVAELRRTEEALREAHDQLEVRVEKRTEELARTVEVLLYEVAERKRVEGALRESEARYRQLLQGIGDGHYALDTEGRFTYVNDVIVERSGRPAAWFLGRHFLDIIRPEDHSLARRHFEAVMRGEQVPVYELAYPTATGELLWVEINTTAWILEGRIVGVQGVSRDVTERRRTEEALRKSELRYRTVSGLISDSVYALRVEDDGTLIPEWGTGGLGHIAGYSVEEAIVHGSWERIIHPDDHVLVRQHLERFFSGQPDVCEYRIVTRNGDVHWVRDYGQPEWDEDKGRVVRIVGAVQDINEQVRIQEALRESEERWRSLVENAPDLVLTVDRKGRIQFINRPPEGTRLSVEQILGESSVDYAVPEHREIVRQSIQAAFETGESGYCEVAAPGLQGGLRWYSTRVGPILRDGKVVAVMIISREVTERRNLEEMKDNLIRDVSHELRTPLAKMQMSLELLLEMLEAERIDRQKVARLGQRSFHNVQRLLRTVEAILDLSALEAGVRPYQSDEVWLRELIGDTIADMEPLAKAQGLVLVSALPPDLPAVEGDAERLFRVLINLIDNAIKFSDEGQIVVTAKEKGGEVEIAVGDSGEGIRPENLDRVFERFFQEKTRHHGVGVGLTICRAIVEAHGGRIWAESPGRGQGSTFRFTLPINHG